MSSTKRKALDRSLQRRVRARRESSEELDESSSISDNPAINESESDPTSEEPSTDEESKLSYEIGEEGEELEGESEQTSETATATISFGALAKASETLSNTDRKKTHAAKSTTSDGWEDSEALERKAGRKDRRDFNRSSKHAPIEMSSKKAVSRRRDVVPVIKRNVRDPRFEPSSGAVDQVKFRKAYGFLNEYREDEMRELRIGIKKEKDEEKKEILKRALEAMENRKRARERKEREEAVLEKHRKEEKELVKQGKQPYYLKKGEVQKRILVDTYKDLKGKKLDKVIERRRKKVEGREKKKMPFARRTAQDS